MAVCRSTPLAAALAVLSLSLLAGCRVVNGSGELDEQTIEVDTEGVDALEVHSGLEAHVEIGTSQTARITGDDNLIPEVLVEVVGGTLRIDWVDVNAIYGPSQPMVVEVEVPALVALQASGGSTVLVGEVATPSLVVETSGGGTLRFEAIDSPEVSIGTSGGGHAVVEALTGTAVHLSSSGGGSWELAGSCPELTLAMSGGGDFAGFELEVEEAQLELSGGGHAELSVSDLLSGSASGGGTIAFRGNPELNVGLSGGATLTRDGS